MQSSGSRLGKMGEVPNSTSDKLTLIIMLKFVACNRWQCNIKYYSLLKTELKKNCWWNGNFYWSRRKKDDLSTHKWKWGGGGWRHKGAPFSYKRRKQLFTTLPVDEGKASRWKDDLILAHIYAHVWLAALQFSLSQFSWNRLSDFIWTSSIMKAGYQKVEY